MDTEVKAPLAILAVSLVVFAVAGFLADGIAGAGATLAGVGIMLAFNMVLGVVALYIAAAVLQIGFGHVGTSLLRLAAVFAAPVAVGLLVPIAIVDILASIVLYWILLAWLFALDARELVVCVIILFLVRLAGGFVLGGVLAGLLG